MTSNGPPVPFAKPTLGQTELEYVARVIESGWVTQGPEVRAFEEEFAAYVGAERACAVSSCTAALHLALLAVGVQPGDEVVTVSLSFIATANAVRYCGAVPVFVDVDPHTLNVDPAKLEAAIGPRTKAILCVHQTGIPCEIERIVEIARRHGIPVVEDAACALGSEVLVGEEWQRIGRPHGDVACFSFHPRKTITTGDGGMITTSAREDIDRMCRMLRQHAMDVPDLARHESRQVVFEKYPFLGFNYRMTDIQAAVGRAQLLRLPEMLEKRRALAARYAEALEPLNALELPSVDARFRPNWQSYWVRFKGEIDQWSLMQRLKELGVETRRGVMCIHKEEAYASGNWRCGVDGCDGCGTGRCRHLAVSEDAQLNTIILPMFPEMSEDELRRVVGALTEVLGN